MRSKGNPLQRDALSIKLFLKSSPKDISDAEVQYFREHPDEIDEITAPVHIHKLFLWIGLLLGSALLGLSKVIAYSNLLSRFHAAVKEFAIDFIFEVGVSLIGAAITAYILGILLNQQQEVAAQWRAEIRQRLKLNQDGE